MFREQMAVQAEVIVILEQYLEWLLVLLLAVHVLGE